MIKRHILTFILLISFCFAGIPSGYYDTVQGKTGTALRAALHDIIDGHTELLYDDIWTAFGDTDLLPNDQVWDMYTGNEWDYPGDQSSGSNNDNTYNREHSWPKSWCNEDYPAYTDLYHLYPVQATANSTRNNNPYGEVEDGTETYTSDNGCLSGPARAGLGYSGTVFEPVDEYKGDLARTYFYMSTRYYSEDSNWLSSYGMTDKSDILPWALDMLLEWHVNDPVSQKELDRIEAVYDLQNNRNPFIDHPEYAQDIWGEPTMRLSAPAALSASNITAVSFTASWNSVAEANGYYLYVSESSDFATCIGGYDAFDVGSATNRTVDNLDSETTYYYRLKAYNNEDISEYSNTVTVTTPAVTTVDDEGGLFISEYIEGSSYNKSIEFFNSCVDDFDLSRVTLNLYSNGGISPSQSLNLSGTLAGRQVYVISHTSADPAILAVTDETSGSLINFNGNDAVELLIDGSRADILGVVGNDSYFAKDITLVRKPQFISGNTTYTASEWENYPKDDFSHLGSHDAADGALPIVLNDFSVRAENGCAVLEWQTASEVENARFNVYRNDDFIAFVNGAGTTSESQNYSYIDSFCVSGMNTYVLASYSYGGQEVRFDSMAQSLDMTGVQNQAATYIFHENYPNPFNPSTTIFYNLPQSSRVRLIITDMNGRIVNRLLSEQQSPGAHRIVWRGLNREGLALGSGIYFYRLAVGNKIHTGKMLLVK